MRGQSDEEHWDVIANRHYLIPDRSSTSIYWPTNCAEVVDKTLRHLYCALIDIAHSVNKVKRIGTPLSDGEQPAHRTDIVMWIDTHRVENSLTKDDASNFFHSSYISTDSNMRNIRESQFESTETKLASHTFFGKFQTWLREATGRIQMLKSFKWEYSTK